jgi:RNA ligase (TIGR02306 family)
MSEWNCQVVRIEKIVKHADADNLSVATVMNDYPVIIKTGQYQEGQLVGYIAVDTVVPDIEDYYFLCPKSYEKYEENGEIKQRQLGPKYPLGSVPERHRTIRAKRIRGTYSQGMLVDATLGLNEGDSIVDVLGLKKYDPPEEEDNIVSIKMRGSNAESPPKGWAIPHFDLDGLRKYANCIQKDEEVVLTEKLNGSNAAFCHDGQRLWVKSRNWFKKRDEDDPWWDIAFRYGLENKLIRYPMIVLFGELVGNVKGFRYTTEVVDGKLMTKVYFFDAYDTQAKRFLDYDVFLGIVKDLGLDPVPELYRGGWKGKEAMYPYAEGQTILGKGIREGFVVKTTKGRYEPKLDGRLALKLVGEGYNLAK